MVELNDIIKKFNYVKRKAPIKVYKQHFTKFGDIYAHTNENLKGYIPNLTDKKVLTVSASGDQLLNIMGKGSLDIDTFDINAISPLFQNLKMYAIRYLSYDDASIFLDNFNKDIYFKFNAYLPNKEREIFDYIYKNYSLEDIFYYMFYPQFTNNKNNNNYFNNNILKKIKLDLKKLKHNHYETDFYRIANNINHKYDDIFLSNISHYSKNSTIFLNYLMYLYNYYLEDNGSIYYAYIYNEDIDDVISAIKRIGKSYETIISLSLNKQLVNNTELLNIDSAEYPGQTNDTVLVLRK